MSPFPRYLGLSLVFLLVFAAGAFFAQNWLLKESSKLQVEAESSMRDRLEAYIAQHPRSPADWAREDFESAQKVLGMSFGKLARKNFGERDNVQLEYEVPKNRLPEGTPSLKLFARSPLPLYGKAALLRDRMLLALLLFGGLLSAGFLFLLLLRLPRREEFNSSSASLAGNEREMQSFLHLAKTSVDREQALASERAERERTSQDLQSNQQMLSRALEERLQLGRDLHDGLIQNLYSAGLTLEATKARLRDDPEAATKNIELVLLSLNRSITEVRGYIQGLGENALRSSGFKQSLVALAEELRGGRDVSLDFRIDEEAAALLTLEQGREVLQIARESISNGLRHGGARNIAVYLGREDRELALLVRDDGKGFNTNNASSGHGLANMDARAKRLGGRWDVQSQEGSGTVIRLFVPILEGELA